MINDETVAWILLEMKSGRSQREIGQEIGMSSSSVCQSLANFCASWSKDTRFIYDTFDVGIIREQALYAFWRHKGGVNWCPEKPVLLAKDVQAETKMFSEAYCEHVFLLRCEGLTLREIGERLGISTERVRQRLGKFEHRMARALRRTRWPPQWETEDNKFRAWQIRR